MNGAFLRREWGAVTFVVTVFLGIIAVLIAFLVVGHPAQSAVSLSTPAPTESASPASGARTASPIPSPSPSPSPSP